MHSPTTPFWTPSGLIITKVLSMLLAGLAVGADRPIKFERVIALRTGFFQFFKTIWADEKIRFDRSHAGRADNAAAGKRRFFGLNLQIPLLGVCYSLLGANYQVDKPAEDRKKERYYRPVAGHAAAAFGVPVGPISDADPQHDQKYPA